MAEFFTSTIGAIQGGFHDGTHTQRWVLDGAAANALYDRIMIEFPRRYFEIWRMGAEPACLAYHETLHGLGTEDDPLLLIFRNDMDFVIETVWRKITELIQNAIDYENVKHFRHTAKLVARAFMPQDLKKRATRGDAESQRIIERCTQESQVRIEQDFAAYLARQGETDRIALTESLVSMATAIRLYMNVEYERMRDVAEANAEQDPVIMNNRIRNFLNVKQLKCQIMQYLGVDCRGDDDVEQEELDELMALMESLADKLQQASGEEFIRLLRDNMGEEFVPA